MDFAILPGKYVVAVSGGVDSVVLLDLLRGRPGVELVVAHFEHGIRADSDEDRKLVEEVAENYGLPFVFRRGNLGVGASEERARHARYKFLREVMATKGAKAIITAHHQDDVIETAILNLIRGTGRRGLSALRSHGDLLRPLLEAPKHDIITYARDHNLRWREDITNNSSAYIRNYIRAFIVPRLGEAGRRELLQIVRRMRELNEQTDQEIAKLFNLTNDEIDRKQFIMLPHAVSREAIAAWLRSHRLGHFDQKTIDRLVIAAKTFAPGKKADILSQKNLLVQKNFLKII
jgi:tRNA(Ile)-lysidine synthetase-like protein